MFTYTVLATLKTQLAEIEPFEATYKILLFLRMRFFNLFLTSHTHIFPKGVVHRVEIGWGLTKVAAVLLNGLLW